MKRSEMIEHIKAELEEMVEVMKLRPKAAKHQPERFANSLLDMIEGFGMLPPGQDFSAETTLSVFGPYEWEKEEND